MSTQSRVTRPKSIKPKGPAAEVDLGFRWGVVNSALLALGVVALAAGYMALAGGSVTLAPVLLVTGYCVIIPAALLLRGPRQTPGD